MTPKFAIGDRPWHATTEHFEKVLTCPDCLGQKYLTVTMGDGSTVTIDCQLCGPGYNPPCGVVKIHGYKEYVYQTEIDGLEIRAKDGATYQIATSYRVAEGDLFSTKEEAEARAVELQREREQAEADRLKRKEKDKHTWAWHVRYHRSEIKRAEKEIAYHAAKLAAAKEHATTERQEAAPCPS